MEQKLLPNLHNVIIDPSVMGGPKTFKDIRVKNKYNEKYNNYIEKNQTIPFQVFSDRHRGFYLFHLQIVSDSDPEVFYDVVLNFFPGKIGKLEDETIDNYDFQVFSNSPGFCFKYAYVYNKGGRIFKPLIKKISEIDTPPNKTNPTKAYGYDYTLYFAMYFLYLNKQYLRKKDLDRIAKPYISFNPDDVLDSYLAFKRRSEKEFDTFKKVKQVTKRITKKPQEAIKKIAKKVGIINSKSAIKPVKAKKAIRSTRRNFK